MKRLYICTAEPSNFVPKELCRAGQQLGLDTKIIDLTKVALFEGLNDDGSVASQLFHVEKEGEESKLVKIEVCDQTVVIPRLNEYHLDVKLAILKRFESCGATLLNSPESMELCNDKLMTHVVLNNASIKSPKSIAIAGEDLEIVVDTLEKDQQLKYPIIVKTLRGTHGIGVMKLDSRASLISVAQTLQKEGLDFIIQEFMEHEQSARMIMIGDQLLAANLRGQPKDKGEFRTNSHLGSVTEPYEPSEDEIALGRRIVELFGCKFCAIDYLIKKLDNGTNELIVLEVNGSPGLENIQKNWPDKDLPLTVVKVACGCQEHEVVVPNQSITDAPSETENQTPTELPAEIVQDCEQVTVHRVITDSVEGRIDTGAKYSSIHADWVNFDKDWTKFRRGDITFKVNTDRIIKIKNVHGGESSSRPLIRLDITIKGKRLNGVEFTVNDRTKMKYEVLIGRNVLELLGLPVVVQQKPGEDAPESEIYTVDE